MSGSTLGVAGMAFVGLAIGAAQVASQPAADEPETPPVAAAPLVVDAPTDPVVPPPPVVSAAPRSALQAAPMDPRDPNSPQGQARTAMAATAPVGYVDGAGQWHNPIIGYVPRPYGAPGTRVPVCRYIQSPYVFGPGTPAVDADLSLMDQFDLLVNHDLGFDARILSPTP